MRNSHEHPGIVAKHLSHVVTLSRLEFCKEHPPFCLLSHSVSRREGGGPSVPDSRLEPETVPPHALSLLRRRCVTPAASFTSLRLSFLFCKIGALIITTRVTAHTVRSLRPGTCRVLSVPKECQPRVLPPWRLGAGGFLCRAGRLCRLPIQPPRRSPALIPDCPLLTRREERHPGDHGREGCLLLRNRGNASLFSFSRPCHPRFETL